MFRGILSTIYVDCEKNVNQNKIIGKLKSFYKKDHFYKKLPIKRRKLMLAKLKRITNNIKYYEHDLYLSGIKEAVFFNFDN